MKNIKTLSAFALLSLISFGSFAQSVTVTADTLDNAQAKIADIAKHDNGASYHITEANTNGNGVHMTAVLTK